MFIILQRHRAGRSVKIKRIGSFTFNILIEVPLIATKSMSISQTNNFDLKDQRLELKYVHDVGLCFVVNEFLQPNLIHYLGKEEIIPAKSQKSI
jgi:hypothetical protein